MSTITLTATTIEAAETVQAPDEAELAAVAFLARYSGRTLDAYRHDLRLPVCGDAAGICTVTRSPPAARGVRLRVPSCAWVMLLTIARPRPTPAWSVRMRLVPR